MTELDMLFIQRRKKGITLKMLSEYIGCSIAMVSLVECEKARFSPTKAQKYKKFIELY
ncbi:helix-turn-helix domain-containing protein [Sporosarcina limicola]|uniref:Transcriptional regulator with XRE-family HTH domain n=1 Tax=Sporosarcina limicola TaxID=34101 RepID=A0A927MLZ4_9BACL|nr:helix-turn-helix transcriptional regulator [Sporosarcina limicola]MBE1557033.1 transcriptional regulator with XRE-family HTH domain [Sporosarcina limicola]